MEKDVNSLDEKKIQKAEAAAEADVAWKQSSGGSKVRSLKTRLPMLHCHAELFFHLSFGRGVLRRILDPPPVR